MTVATIESLDLADVDWPDEIPQIEERISEQPQVTAQPLQPLPLVARAPIVEPLPQVADVAEEPATAKLPPSGVSLTVDHVRVSENTYAFRIRWSNRPGVTPKRPAIYFQWVRVDVFQLITENKDIYGSFKNNIISEFVEQQKTI